MNLINQLGKYMKDKLKLGTESRVTTTGPQRISDKSLVEAQSSAKVAETAGEMNKSGKPTLSQKKEEETLKQIDDLQKMLLERHIFSREKASGVPVVFTHNKPFQRRFVKQRLGYNLMLKRKLNEIKLKKMKENGTFINFQKKYRKKPVDAKYKKEKMHSTERMMGYWHFQNQPTKHQNADAVKQTVQQEAQPLFPLSNKGEGGQQDFEDWKTWKFDKEELIRENVRHQFMKQKQAMLKDEDLSLITRPDQVHERVESEQAAKHIKMGNAMELEESISLNLNQAAMPEDNDDELLTRHRQHDRKNKQSKSNKLTAEEELEEELFGEKL